LLTCAWRLNREVDVDGGRVGSLQIYGWGETEAGVLSDVLMTADVSVFDRQRCNRRGVFGPHVKQNMFCAQGHGRDACVGDSGGPITTREGGEEVLAGVTSFGRANGCVDPDTPTVYTLISPFLAWVRETARLEDRSPARSPTPPSSDSWWRPEILEIIGGGSGGGCGRGGDEWLPGGAARGCTHCGTYQWPSTVAACLECCCAHGGGAHAGCPGRSEEDSPARRSAWSPRPSWDWDAYRYRG